MPILADTQISSLGYLWRDTDKSRYFAITAEVHNSCIIQTPSLFFDKYYRRRNLARKTIFRVTSNGLRYEENHPSGRDTFTIHLLCSLPWLTVVCETKWSETKWNETKWNETKWKSVVCEMRICSLRNENL